MRRRVLPGVVSVVLLSAFAGCEGRWERCPEADPAVVKQIMAAARTDFRPTTTDGRPGGVHVDHLTFLESAVGQLPKKDRKFGADQLVVLLVSTTFGGEDASESFPGIHEPIAFVLDAEGKLLGPAGAYTAEYFDLESPTDPGWLEWGGEVEVSKLGNDLFACVQPV